MAQPRLSNGPDKSRNTAHNVYPDRPGKPDCRYYMRTGTCAYGSNCRYNHPTYIGQDWGLPESEGQSECQNWGLPESEGQSECQDWGLPESEGQSGCQDWGLPESEGQSECQDWGLPESEGQSGWQDWGLPESEGQSECQDWGLPESEGQSECQGWGLVKSEGQSECQDLMDEISMGQPRLSDGPDKDSNTAHNVYPDRPGEPDCSYYMRTGTCAYGSKCRYNHPTYIGQDWDLPQREGQPECQFFLKTGTCRYGSTCKYHHPREKINTRHERKEEEIRELEETLQREKQEKDQLRREIEENEHEKLLSKEIIEQVKAENDLLKSQRDEHFNQIQVANERRLALEKQVSDLELLVQELCIQSENMHCGSSTSLNSEFSLQELQQATQNFSETLKIGEGGFGPVYKGSLRRTKVAIKLLHSQSLEGISQFQQEITILTKVRHPNLVTLIGACSEVSALVYEYLSNGSLEDRLTCANNTPPLTWQTRTRIIGEICLALIFLHSNKPQLVVHGDLKPGNILLDTNLVSKLSDFGISRLLKQPDTNSTAFFHTSRPAGTFSYIDPEYLSTGILTPKSDIYSFGIIILRLITGKPPMNIARQVKDARRNGTLLSVIDEKAGAWPFEQAKELAMIALRCVKSSRSQRPDLVNEVWAVVEPLMKAASSYMGPQSHGSELGEESIPSHFICPINQEVMQDPCIAADGFTYEADAIRQWLRRGHNTSPMTNLPLPHHNLIQNRVLRSAIQEWLEQHPQS